MAVKTADVLGKYVKVKGIRYRVIGTAKPKGMQMSIRDSLDDEKLFIPITTAFMDFNEEGYFSRILVSPVEKARYKQAEEEIRNKLARLHGFEPEDKDALQIYIVSYPYYRL